MHWNPKRHKNQTVPRFITSRKTCFTKQISKSLSNVVKLVYPPIENLSKSPKL